MNKQDTAHGPPCSGTKRCPRCQLTHHVLAFAVDRAQHDGLRVYCRDCCAAINHAEAMRDPQRQPRKRASYTLPTDRED